MRRLREPTFALSIVKPFVRLLRSHGRVPDPLADMADRIENGEGRMPVAEGIALCDEISRTLQDPELGLHAAFFTRLDDFEVLEWVATSAATWRAANEMVCRYVHVLNEAGDYRLEIVGEKAHLILGSAIALPRAMSDFQLAAYHLAIRMRIPEVPPELEVWTKLDQPADVSGYRAIFPSAKLVFRAPFDGFVSDAWRLDMPLPTADATVHTTVRAHAEALLATLDDPGGLVERVSADIGRALCNGTAQAELTAARLGMSRRTLSRRLAERGTSYAKLLQETRYRSAIHYLRHSRLGVEDIAFLLGFSECAPFVRAFKRWSGHPPLQYRRQQQKA